MIKWTEFDLGLYKANEMPTKNPGKSREISKIEKNLKLLKGFGSP